MSPGTTAPAVPTLPRIADFAQTQHEFFAPSKKINDGNDLEFFFTTRAYRDLTIWLLQLTRAMFPTKNADGTTTPCIPESVVGLSANVQNFQAVLHELTSYVDQAPPHTGPRRYGNIAFRTWFQTMEENIIPLLRACFFESASIRAVNPDQEDALLEELKSYLLGSFGSSPRLDYGTGHELAYLAFLGCLWKLGAFEDGEERAIVCHLIRPYLTLVRKLIVTYKLEPAGSHGVWGLDDHSFLPYILGSAQLGPGISPDDYWSPLPIEGSLPNAPSPASVTDKVAVAQLQYPNLFFSAIQFIYDVKTGPFWEHSPVLYDISGIKDGWGKVNKGMLKMYAGEVLGKFPVVQHFPFGSMFRWERDPEAAAPPSTLHAQQQPPATTSHGMPPGPASSAVGTSAPWARPNAGSTQMPQMQAATGLPTARAPVDPRASMGPPPLRRPPPADGGKDTKPR